MRNQPVARCLSPLSAPCRLLKRARGKARKAHGAESKAHSVRSQNALRFALGALPDRTFTRDRPSATKPMGFFRLAIWLRRGASPRPVSSVRIADARICRSNQDGMTLSFPRWC